MDSGDYELADAPHAPLAMPNTTQNATAPAESETPNMAKMTAAIRSVVGRATVRLPQRSAANPTVTRARQAEPLRIAACRAGTVSRL